MGIVAFPTPPAQRYYGPFGVWGKKYAAVLSWWGGAVKISHVKFFTAEQLGIQSEPSLFTVQHIDDPALGICFRECSNGVLLAPDQCQAK